MAVKAVEMIRKIRDRHFEETKRLSAEEQIAFVKKKSGELKKRLKASQRLASDERGQATRV